jgi:hypothetical protein
MKSKFSKFVCFAFILFILGILSGCSYLKYVAKTIVFGSNYQLTEATGLPVLRINTEKRKITSTEIWVENASYTLHGSDGSLLAEGPTDVKGRGHTTWTMPKKPYALKLADKTSFFGMPEHKRWAVLANFADKTLLRNEIAFKMGYIFDNLAWTPHSAPVDLFLNGKYLGVYQLTEQVKVDKNRVNVNGTISAENPAGGYLLEVDSRRGDPFNFTTTMEAAICLSDPDDGYNESAGGVTLFDKVKTDVQHLEDVLYGNNFTDPDEGYRKYLDVDSLIDWYLVNEITKNNDARLQSSVYFYFDADLQKYRFGPLWDFDISMGNIDYTDCEFPEGFWVKDAKWISRLYEDPSFRLQLKNRWNEKKSEVNAIFQFIDERAAYLEIPQTHNFKKWIILKKEVWPNPQVSGSYAGEIDYLKTWLVKRLSWFDTAINDL